MLVWGRGMGTFLVGLGRHNERGCPAPRSPACALLPEPARLYENSGTLNREAVAAILALKGSSSLRNVGPNGIMEGVG